jgi:hypothetical protein
VGQKGQGPGDFYRPIDINCYNGCLYILDSGNNRLVKLDKNLKELEIFKLTDPTIFSLHVINDNTILGCSRFSLDSVYDWVKQKKSKLAAQKILSEPPVVVLNLKGEVQNGFLHSMDINTKYALENPGRWRATNRIRIGYAKGNEIFLTYSFPYSDMIAFYLYSIDGRLIREFNYSLDKKYKFPDHFFTSPPTPTPNGFSFASIQDVFIYKNKLLAIINLFTKPKGKEDEVERYCLLFNKQGEFLNKIDLPVDIKIFFISQDGYVLAKMYDEDIEKLYIYKLNF